MRYLFPFACLLLLVGCGDYSLKEYDAPSSSYSEARHKFVSWSSVNRADRLIMSIIDKLEERVKNLEEQNK